MLPDADLLMQHSWQQERRSDDREHGARLCWACLSGLGAMKKAGVDSDERNGGGEMMMMGVFGPGGMRSGGIVGSGGCGVKSREFDSCGARAERESLEGMARRMTILLVGQVRWEGISLTWSGVEGRALRRDRAMWFATCAWDGVGGGAGSYGDADSIGPLETNLRPLRLRCVATYGGLERSERVCSRLLSCGNPEAAHTHIADDALPSPGAGSAASQSLSTSSSLASLSICASLEPPRQRGRLFHVGGGLRAGDPVSFSLATTNCCAFWCLKG